MQTMTTTLIWGSFLFVLVFSALGVMAFWLWSKSQRLEKSLVAVATRQAELDSCQRDLKNAHQRINVGEQATDQQIQTLIRTVNTLQQELAETKAELVRLRTENERLRAEGVSLRQAQGTDDDGELYLFTVSERIFDVDAVALRQSGWRFRRVEPVTKSNLRSTMDRLRELRRRVYVHFSCHGDPDLLTLEDGHIFREEVSEILDGVDIRCMVLASCKTVEIGDALVMPGRSVITMANDVESDDAEIFTRVFWRQMRVDFNVRRALDVAQEASPSRFRESVFLHQI